MIKKLSRTALVRSTLCFLTAQYVSMVYLTSRWQVVGSDGPEKFIREGKPFIVAFWHGRLLMLPCTWDTKRPLHLLISQHHDGELISRTVNHLGLRSVRGSTNKRGAQALRRLVRKLRAGEWVGITPDGPHGPRMRASDGVVQLARLANVPIFPLVYSAKRAKALETWDRFLVPFPFTRGIFIWDKPILPPTNNDGASIEDIRMKIEESLIKISKEADQICGRKSIQPDPLISSAATNENT